MGIFQCLPTQEVISMLIEIRMVQSLPISLDSYSTCSEYVTFIEFPEQTKIFCR